MEGMKNCSNLGGVKFSYAIAKNINIIQNELEPLIGEIKKIQDKHAIKDSNGNAAMNGKQILMRDINEFEKDYNELTEIENDNIKLHKIKREDLPKDITSGQLTGIFDLIEE